MERVGPTGSALFAFSGTLEESSPRAVRHGEQAQPWGFCRQIGLFRPCLDSLAPPAPAAANP